MGRLAALSAHAHALFAALVLVACGYLFHAGILEPQLLELQATGASLRTERALLAEKRRAAADHVVAEERLEGLRQRITQSDARFFSPREASTFFANLHGLAESAHCRLTSVDFLGEKSVASWRKSEKKPATSPGASEHGGTVQEGEMEKPRRLVRAAARLSLTGTYPQVIDFLQATTRRPQTIDVSGLTLRLASRNAADLNVGLVISVWWLDKEEIVR